MRFLASADWQLGMSAHYLDDEARPRFHQARFDAVRRIGVLAGEVGAEFVVVGGDVFESNKLDRAVVSRALEALSDYPVPVVLLPGNHDPLDAASIYDDPTFVSRLPAHVHVIRAPGIYSLMDGVEIVGAPWFSKRPLTDLVAQATADLPPVPAQTFRIVLGHGAADSLNPDRDDPATIAIAPLRALIESGQAHFVVLGDRHGMKEVATGIWYPGAPEVTARREIDPGYVLIVDLEHDPATVASRQVGEWSFQELGHYFAGDSDVDAFEKALAQMPHKARTALWLSLTGTLSTSARVRLDAIIDEYADLFAKIDFWARHTELVTVAEDGDFADLGLTGFAANSLVELQELAGSGAENAGVAQDSLGLLYRLASGVQQ